MKNLNKKRMISAMAAAIMSVSVFSLGVSAASNYGHSTDEWYSGFVLGILLDHDMIKQYSEFYCKEDGHSATVKMRKKGNTNYDVYKAHAKKGKWAKANSGYYAKDKNIETRRSYYDHDNM